MQAIVKVEQSPVPESDVKQNDSPLGEFIRTCAAAAISILDGSSADHRRGCRWGARWANLKWDQWCLTHWKSCDFLWSGALIHRSPVQIICVVPLLVWTSKTQFCCACTTLAQFPIVAPEWPVLLSQPMS